MKKLFIITIIVGLLIANNANAQSSNDDPKYKINPTPDKTAFRGFYIPKDLDDCFKELNKMLSPELIKEMKAGTEDDMSKHHFGLGLWMRNNWGLWSGSHLAKYFNNLGIRHPDDMSGIILTSFWRFLNKKPLKIDDQTQYYKNYWEKVKQQPHKAK